MMIELLAETSFFERFIDLASKWVPQVFLALVTLVLGWKLANMIGSMVGRQLDKRDVDATLVPFLTSLISVLIKAGVVISAITTLGIEATSFAALFAAVGLAMGMALSGTLQNFAGGVILLLLRPFKVGDTIEAQGYTGTVEEIRIFETILITGDNRVIHIPNGKLHNDSLINYSTKKDRRVDFVFGIGYEDDLEKARRVILKVIDGYDQVRQDPAPFVRVGELAESSVNFTVRVWARSEDYWDLHFGITEDVKKAFDAEGISIPFPQQDVRMHQVNK